MNRLVLLLLLIVSINTSAQDTRGGGTPLSSIPSKDTGKTYAVIIGISTYQNIHKLQFADRDAKAFYGFLTSKSGGNVDSSNINLLINQQARAENMYKAINQWLMVKKKPQKGDKVFIYFAGHGDAIAGEEDASWLLGWDVPNTDPSIAYYTNGGIDVVHLKAKIQTMEKAGVRVLLITDACRGKELPPGGESGREAFFGNILEKREGSNEIQFASCSAGEVSREDKIWGGGRGLYSYWLLNGLYGMADKDSDGFVTSGELKEYVEQHVKAATKRKDASGEIYYDQKPFYCCSENDDEKISKVDPVKKQEITEMLSQNENGAQLLAFNRKRGISSTTSPLSDTVKSLYEKFENQIQYDTAISYDWKNYMLSYTMLLQQPLPEELRSNIKDELTIALFDHSQLVMNFFVQNKKYKTNSFLAQLFSNTVACLDTAMKLTDKNDDLYLKMKWNRLLLEAEAYFCNGGDYNEKINMDLMKEGLKDLDRAKLLNPKPSPVLFQAYNNIYFALGNYTEALKNELEANRLAPKWIYPLNNIGAIYSTLKQYDSAEKYFEKTLQIDSTFTLTWWGLGYIYSVQKQYNMAKKYFLKALQLDTMFIDTWREFGNIYFNQGKYDSAEKYFQKTLQLDTTNIFSWDNLGYTYYVQAQYTIAEKHFRKALQIDSTDGTALNALGLIYFVNQQYAGAEQFFLMALKSDSSETQFSYNLASTCSLQNEKEKALKYLEKCINAGYKNYTDMQKDPNFDNIRNTLEFKALMKKYFPDEYKE